MPAYCIPKENIEKVKKVFARLKDGGLETLMKKTREDKIKLFKKVLPEDEARLFVDGLEHSFASKRLRAFGDYLKKNLDPAFRKEQITKAQKQSVRSYLAPKLKGKSERYIDKIISMKQPVRENFINKLFGKNGKEINEQINNKLQTKLDSEINFLGENFKSLKEIDNYINKKSREVVEEAEGLSLTREETEKILEIGKKIEEATKKVSNIPKEKNGRLNDDYVEALSQKAQAERESEKFLFSKAKTKVGETINSHLKALMLLRPSTIAVNIISNKESSVFNKLVKRISSGQIKGYNPELAKDMVKAMYKISQDTSETIFGKKIGVGYDLSRSLSLDDMMKKNIIGEKMEVGRDTFFTRLVFETGLGRADYHSARIAFVDTLNLESSKMANKLGLTGEKAKQKAKELMLDAFELIPKTEEGQALRKSAVADALRATWTDNRVLSKTLLKAREGLNKLTLSDTTGLKFGDLLEPFVKTTSNIIQFGTDISGLGIPKSVYKFIKYNKNKTVLKSFEAEKLLNSAIRDLVGSIGGIGSAFVLSSLIDENNFMGAYDPNRMKYDELRNSNTDSINIFGHWVSTDYNILATPLVAMMYAKKYGGKNTAEMTFQYAKGVATQTLKAPVVSTFAEMAVDFNRKFGQDSELKDAYKYLADVLVTQISSRVPGFLQDITQVIDDTRRDTTKYRDKFLAKIPGLSKKAPAKVDMLGDIIKTETGNAETFLEKIVAGFLQIMAGARVKKAKTEELRQEILRLKDVGYAPTITDWKYRVPPKLQKLKEKVGEDEYRRIFTDEYGVKLREKFLKRINSGYYKTLSEEEKKKDLDKIEDEVINSIYTKNNIK